MTGRLQRSLHRVEAAVAQTPEQVDEFARQITEAFQVPAVLIGRPCSRCRRTDALTFTDRLGVRWEVHGDMCATCHRQLYEHPYRQLFTAPAQP